MESQPAIEYYTAKRIPNPYPPGELPWQVYHTVRNAVLRCCRDFGRTGPLGECPITDDEAPPDEPWHVVEEVKTLDYFVVDDQLNHERYVYVEPCKPAALTATWLRAMTNALRDYEGWGVGINLAPDAYILAFADRLMVTGDGLEHCHDCECVVREIRARFEKRYTSEGDR